MYALHNPIADAAPKCVTWRLPRLVRYMHLWYIYRLTPCLVTYRESGSTSVNTSSYKDQVHCNVNDGTTTILDMLQ